MDIEPPSLLLSLLISSTHLTSGILVVVLLVFSALISGAEVALFSLTATHFEEEKENINLQRVKRLLEKPKKLLATILVANNFINIAIVLLFNSLGETLFSTISTNYYGVNIRFIVEVGIVTFLILLFGEILPKIYATRKSKAFASFMSSPLFVLDKLLTPVSVPMSRAISYIQEKFGKKKSSISVDHLSQALELTSKEDTTQEEHKILKGIVNFGNTDVKQVMTPRMDVFALDESAAYSAIIPQIMEHGYSRIPVYKEQIDTITGVLYVKDLVPYIDKSNFNWTSLLREPYFVPENKKLDDLLNEFKSMKMHLAIVVDEYGGTSGLISLEDIIEEIVGEISDEFDDEEIIYSKLDEKTYVFEGKTPLKDFYKIIKPKTVSVFEDAKGEAETLAGFILEISKGFPKKNETIVFKTYTFTIEAFENKRIKRIKISIN